MKTMQWALLGIGGYFALKFLGIGNAGANMQIVFNGVQVNGPLNYTLQFLAQNVTNTSLQLNSLAADVTINGQSVGNVSTFTPVTIAANSSTPVNLTLLPSILGVAGEVIDMLNNPPPSLSFEAKGAMNIGGAALPFDLTKEISLQV